MPSAEQMDAIADLAERYSFDEVRVTHEQNLVLPHVRIEDLRAVYAALHAIGLAEANAGLVTDIIACPGLDYCALANARSIPIAQRISERLAARQDEIGDLKIKISGCINACGHHHVGHIGILGVEKRGEEHYQLLLGGSGARMRRSPPSPAPASAPTASSMPWRRWSTPTSSCAPSASEPFLAAYGRLGPAPFKEALYAPPLDPDAGLQLATPWETDSFSPNATSSPRRVEDATPARRRGPMQASANSGDRAGHRTPAAAVPRRRVVRARR